MSIHVVYPKSDENHNQAHCQYFGEGITWSSVEHETGKNLLSQHKHQERTLQAEQSPRQIPTAVAFEKIILHVLQTMLMSHRNVTRFCSNERCKTPEPQIFEQNSFKKARNAESL